MKEFAAQPRPCESNSHQAIFSAFLLSVVVHSALLWVERRSDNSEYPSAHQPSSGIAVVLSRSDASQSRSADHESASAQPTSSNEVADLAPVADPQAAAQPLPAEPLEQTQPETLDLASDDDALVTAEFEVVIEKSDIRDGEIVTELAANLEATVAASRPKQPEVSLPIEAEQRRKLGKQLDQLRDKLSELETVTVPMTWEIDDQLYRVRVDRIAPQSSTDLERAIVTIATSSDGVDMSTQVPMKRLAFSSYAHLVNRWDPAVELSGDVIEGRFHSNSAIKVSRAIKRGPVFSGKVSIASNKRPGRGLRSQSSVFRGGLETGVKPVRFPKTLQPTASTVKAENILFVAGDAEIVFQPGGGYNWYLKSDPESLVERPLASDTQYIVGADGAVVSVQGTVKGSVVVYAAEKILITGNLIYATDPIEHPQSSDYLGLISEKYVEIAPPKTTGVGDIMILAAIFAKRRFVVRRPRVRSHSLLTIFGSLTAGSVSESEPRFSTLLKFDPRFENRRLPGFPVTDSYEMEAWSEHWKIE